MDWPVIGKEIVLGGGKTALMLLAILIPLMVLLELLRDSGLLERMAVLIRPVMRIFKLPQEGAYPLLAGVFIGISYGSGVILAFSREGNLNTRDMTLIAVFLSLCHGMIEDPLLFVPFGADWRVVILTRAVAGVLSMIIASRLLKPSANTDPELASG